jgi:hypothetical protein
MHSLEEEGDCVRKTCIFLLPPLPLVLGSYSKLKMRQRIGLAKWPYPMADRYGQNASWDSRSRFLAHMVNFSL